VRRSTCASFTGTQKQECLLVQGFSCSPQTRQQPSQSDSSSALHIIIEAAAALLPLLQHPVAVQKNAHHSCFKTAAQLSHNNFKESQSSSTNKLANILARSMMGINSLTAHSEAVFWHPDAWLGQCDMEHSLSQSLRQGSHRKALWLPKSSNCTSMCGCHVFKASMISVMNSSNSAPDDAVTTT